MQPDQFDQLARALAHGATRRQVLKGLAAGMGAHLLATMGFGATRPTPAYAASEGVLYVPMIRTGRASICSVGSTCENKIYCSEDQSCLCIKTAEGDIRCGKIPSCSAQRCTTSADCAQLGEGYFCDSPGSGCCDNEQRCLAPCDAEIACPPARTCGSTCCEPGTICSNGACVDPIEGVWTGTVSYEGQSIGIRFVLSRDSSTNELSGRMLMLDPVTNEYLESGAITGSVYNSSASWYTEADSYISGDFADASFTGLFSFPARHGEPGFDAALSLQRTGDAG
ncbi:MAG TPA: hypothetical protein VNK95_18635 [Caldilineaceae bacterium]|nr:hypothetical protein [Caldilineaceae bacterium]